MAIYDIIFAESDALGADISEASGTVLNILFDNSHISEIAGINGTATEVVFDDNTINEVPSVMITDFAFL
jgi:hypothetical protein